MDGKVIPREMLKPDEFAFNRAAPILTQLERLPDRLVIHQEPSKREQNEVELIKRMISSYFSVVKKTINDIIPKTIITFLINKVP